jgi:hypothetical protein
MRSSLMIIALSGLLLASGIEGADVRACVTAVALLLRSKCLMYLSRP